MTQFKRTRLCHVDIQHKTTDPVHQRRSHAAPVLSKEISILCVCKCIVHGGEGHVVIPLDTQFVHPVASGANRELYGVCASVDRQCLDDHTQAVNEAKYSAQKKTGSNKRTARIRGRDDILLDVQVFHYLHLGEARMWCNDSCRRPNSAQSRFCKHSFLYIQTPRGMDTFLTAEQCADHQCVVAITDHQNPQHRVYREKCKTVRLQ